MVEKNYHNDLPEASTRISLVFRLSKFYAWQASLRTTKNLKTSLRFPCLSLNPITGSTYLAYPQKLSLSGTLIYRAR